MLMRSPCICPFPLEKQWTSSHSGMKNMPLDATLTCSHVYKNEFGSVVCGVNFPQECGACYCPPSTETCMVSTVIGSPSHGQFCVACNAVGSVKQLYIHGCTGRTKYVIQVLLHTCYFKSLF